ncbi:hypothetical protein M9457_27920, partial [Klebsiella pneumoniae]|nr:hypothetical protein [Klebsiella pneumoniae]
TIMTRQAKKISSFHAGARSWYRWRFPRANPPIFCTIMTRQAKKISSFHAGARSWYRWRFPRANPPI